MTAIIATEDFEGTADGVALSTSNTVFNAGPYGTGTFAFSTTTAHDGSASAKVVTTTASKNMASTLSDQSMGWFVVYFRSTAAPSANNTLIQIANNSTVVCEVQISTTGTIRLRDQYTTVATSSAVTYNAWHRLAMKVDPGSATGLRARLYLDSNVDGSTADWDSGDKSCTNAGQSVFDEFRIGHLTATNATTYFDDLHTDDTNEWLPTPESGAPYAYHVIIGS